MAGAPIGGAGQIVYYIAHFQRKGERFPPARVSGESAGSTPEWAASLFVWVGVPIGEQLFQGATYFLRN